MENYSILLKSSIILCQSNAQNLYGMVSNVTDDKIYIMVTRDFEKAGLVKDDIVRCKTVKNDYELVFDAKIDGIELKNEGMLLVLAPSTEIEKHINIRNEKRIDIKFVAFADENNLISTINLSSSGISFLTNIQYKIGDKVKIKLLISHPSMICDFIGEVKRTQEIHNGKKECGLKIIQFKTPEDENTYKTFIAGLVKAFENIS